jgi:hypothetical protein
MILRALMPLVACAALLAANTSATAQSICSELLREGIRDTEQTQVSESRFSEIQAQVCSSSYDSYDKAVAQSAAGNLDVIGIFGLSAGGSNNSQEYSEKRRAFCSSDYSKTTSDSQLRTTFLRANATLLHSFDHCVSVTSQEFIRYVEPQSSGRTFSVVFEDHRTVGPFQLQELSLIDVKDPRKRLDLAKDCSFRHRLPYPTDANQRSLAIVCVKAPQDSYIITGQTTAGTLMPVTVPAVLQAPASIESRLGIVEASLKNLASSNAPVGSILPFTLAKADLDALAPFWVPADGRTLSDPLSPLNGKVLPDLRDRFTFGADATKTNVTVEDGSTVGGSQTAAVTLNADTGNEVMDHPDHQPKGRVGTVFPSMGYVIDTATDEIDYGHHTHHISTTATIPSVLPPFRRVVYMIRVR